MSDPDGFGKLRHVMTIMAPGARVALLFVNFGGGALVGTAVGPAGCACACAPTLPGSAMVHASATAKPTVMSARRKMGHRPRRDPAPRSRPNGGIAGVTYGEDDNRRATAPPSALVS